MKKIPVGATIAHAYRFVFKDFLKILGVVWVPWAIMVAGGLALTKTSMAFSSAITTHDFATVWRILILLGPFYLFALFLFFMQITGIAELALGLRTGSPYYYFSVAKPVWRVIGAFVLLVLVIIGCWIAMVIGGIALGFILNQVSKAAMVWVLVPAGIAAFCAYIYVLLRSSFLLIPVVMAEGRISLARSWKLGRGNFWRIFLILLAIMVPAVAVEFIFVFKVLFQGLPPTVPLHATPQQVAAAKFAGEVWAAAYQARISHNWFWIYPLFGIFTALFYGASCGSQCFAYRAATEDEINSNPH